MRFYNIPIKMKDWRRVAVQCMNTFPKIFEDKDDDGSRLDNGYNSILRKFQDHYHYLGSVCKKRPRLCANLNIRLKHRRTLEAMKSGTIDWQPAQLPEGETEDSIETKRIAVKSLCENGTIATVTGNDVENLLSATYCSQRLFLNTLEKPPKIEKILETWPALFNTECLLWHFEKLTGVSMNKLRTNFDEKITKILLYGKYKWKFELSRELSLEEGQHKAVEILQIQFREQENHLLRHCNFYMKPEDLFCNEEQPNHSVQNSKRRT